MQLLEFFEARVGRGQSLALVVVLATEGSSYSKAAHPMLVDDDGMLQGMLSGGCLEADLAERCIEAIAGGTTTVVEYDLRNDDELFGLAVGCDGAMRVALCPLTPDNDYEPFSRVVASLRDHAFVDVQAVDAVPEAVFRWVSPARILLLGAGLDAQPLIEMCRSLGWQVTANDHRPSWADAARGFGTIDVRCLPADEVGQSIDLSQFDAAIVMSHNLEADRAYLEQLASVDVPFVGLLGPPHRRDRLLSELPGASQTLVSRLRSPVGREIGGRGPASIALEIAVELQAWICELDQRLSRAARSEGVSISTAAASKPTVITASG